MIPFNIPFLTGNETKYIEDAVLSGKISGNGKYTQLCHNYFENQFKFQKVFLTSSCTDALEMSAILSDLKPGDEVIIPSFTFVSTANAFALRGVKIVFADSLKDNPNIDANEIEKLITANTKAIIVVHYAGVACDMDKIDEIAKKHNLILIEDAAQAIDSYYKNKALGTLGSFGTFSFHETKNIISGEGGMLTVNNKNFIDRAEIIWEKGTNRSAFFRGEVDKYNWIDIGSSFLPSDIIAAFLYAQIENLEEIQRKRKKIRKYYIDNLTELCKTERIVIPGIPDYATDNAHMLYLLTRNIEERTKLINHLKSNGILAVFHYLPLHSSPYYAGLTKNKISLPNAEHFADTLLRLPFYYELKQSEQDFVIEKIYEFYKGKF